MCRALRRSFLIPPRSGPDLPSVPDRPQVRIEQSIVSLAYTPPRRSIAEIFRIQVVSNPDVRTPIITLGSTSFFHVRHENLYVAAVTKCNANAALVFEFLYRFIVLGKGYFGKFDEEAVKNNFVLIYELLDGTFGLVLMHRSMV